MERTQHNLGLDFVRAGAILAVLVSHTTPWWWTPGRPADISAAFAGRIGVEAFFSLSGFLIGGILMRASEGGFGPRALGQFWTRRWLRTLPAYWVLLLTLDCYYGGQDWRSPLFLQNFVPKTEWTPLTPHTWSLVLEEWFYLFVPLLLMGGLAMLRRRPRWAMPVVCGALILACTAGRALVGLAPNPVWGPEPDLNPVLRLDCAAWGVLAAWLIRKHTPSRWLAWALLAGGALMLLVLGQVWTRAFEPERLIPWGWRLWGAIYTPARPSLEELAAACIVLGLHRLLPRGGGPLAWFAGATARLSYALYLVHVPVIALSRTAGLGDGGSWAESWEARLGITVLVVGAALLMRYGVELPALALRDRLAPERRPARVGAVSAGP